MSATIVLAIGLAEIESTVDTTTQNQQQINNSNHGPVSKDLLFTNWLLMCLAGNKYDLSTIRHTAMPMISA